MSVLLSSIRETPISASLAESTFQQDDKSLSIYDLFEQYYKCEYLKLYGSILQDTN